MEQETNTFPTRNPRLDTGIDRGKPVMIKVNGQTVRSYDGETIAAALVASGMHTIRHTHQPQDPRGLYCCMGACHGCLVTVNGRPNIRACVTPVEPGQEIVLQYGWGRFDPDAPASTPGNLLRKDVPILVVGGGPAGLSAALSAARSEAEVLIIDENRQPGGQIYRRLPEPFRIKEPEGLGRDFSDGSALMKQVADMENRITLWTDATVWAVFDDKRIAVMRNNALVLIDARAIIVAAGAYERPFPIPGWTLPGVMTVGGAQTLIKSQRISPGKRVLLAGTGPLQLVVANQMLDAGMEVVAVADAASTRVPVRYLFNLLRRLDLLKQGFQYLFRLRKAGVQLLSSRVLKAVEGDGTVERAVLCRVDSRSNPMEENLKTFDVDTVCIGYGLIPDTRVTRMLGCGHHYDPMTGGWAPVFNENMETDRAGIFAAGDGAGVAGVLVAQSQGAVAGLYAAAHCGVIPRDRAEALAESYRKELASLHPFRYAMDRMYPNRPALYANITDDTMVCRCEGVTAGEIREAIRSGTVDPSDIKKRTRAGMGYCQGANCFPTIAMILAREFGAGPETVRNFTPRPPARPIPLNLLIADLNE